MHRHTPPGLNATLSVAVVGLLIASLSFAQQPLLQGGVQQNQTLPADEYAAGRIDCSWNMGACDMLHAYVQQGGSNPTCRAILEKGVELERQEQQLVQGSAQSYALDKKAGELQQQRDRVLASLPPDCFAAGGRANWPRPNRVPGDGYPPPLPRPQPYPPPPPGPETYAPPPGPIARPNGDGSIGPFPCSMCPNGTQCYYPPKAMTVMCVDPKNAGQSAAAGRSGDLGCLDRLGRWIANGFCQPAQAAEYNPAPQNIEPGTYDVKVWTRPPAGTGVRTLRQAGQATVTTTGPARSAVKVTYDMNPDTGQPYGIDANVTVTRTGEVQGNGSSAAVFEPPSARPARGALLPRPAHGTLLPGRTPAGASGANDKPANLHVFVQQVQNQQNPNAMLYNFTWRRPNKPDQEEQWVQQWVQQ